MSYYEPAWDAEGNPEVGTWAKEEPDCGECSDSGTAKLRGLTAIVSDGRFVQGASFGNGIEVRVDCHCTGSSDTESSVSSYGIAHHAATAGKTVAEWQATPDEPPF